MDTNTTISDDVKRNPNSITLTHEEKTQIEQKTEKVLINIIKNLNLNEEQAILARNILLRKTERLLIDEIKSEIEKKSKTTIETTDPQNISEQEPLSQQIDTSTEKKEGQEFQTILESEKKV